MIAQAAGIQAHLTAAGIPEAGVHHWWRRTRRELGGLSPADCVALVGARAGAVLLDLAAGDAAAFERDTAGPFAGRPAAVAPYDEGRASTCPSRGS